MGTCNWGGYEFQICDPNLPWHDVPGLYIFAKRGTPGYWNALYVGRTESFRDRLTGHERWTEAVALGATHVHAMVEYSGLQRIDVESRLIATFRPPLNREGV